jgi:hypothetical protein
MNITDLYDIMKESKGFSINRYHQITGAHRPQAQKQSWFDRMVGNAPTQRPREILFTDDVYVEFNLSPDLDVFWGEDDSPTEENLGVVRFVGREGIGGRSFDSNYSNIDPNVFAPGQFWNAVAVEVATNYALHFDRRELPSSDTLRDLENYYNSPRRMGDGNFSFRESIQLTEEESQARAKEIIEEIPEAMKELKRIWYAEVGRTRNILGGSK